MQGNRIQQTFGDFVVAYKPDDETARLVRHGDPTNFSNKLTGVTKQTNEKAPSGVVDQSKLIRSFGAVIENTDLTTLKLNDSTTLNLKGKYVQCFNQADVHTLKLIGGEKVMTKDYRVNKDIVSETNKIVDAERYVLYDNSLLCNLPNTDLVAAVCTKNNVKCLSWLRHNTAKNSLERIRSIPLRPLTFAMVTSFQAVSDGEFIMLAFAGYNSRSDMNSSDTARIDASLYKLGDDPKWFADVKCVPSGTRNGPPSGNPPFAITSLIKANKPAGFKILAIWPTNRNLVSWEIDHSSAIPKIIHGVDVQNDASNGIRFDQTVSITSSSIDDQHHSVAGFAINAAGENELFSLSRQRVDAVDRSCVKTWSPDAINAVPKEPDADVLCRGFKGMSLVQGFDEIDSDSREIGLAGISLNTVYGAVSNTMSNFAKYMFRAADEESDEDE